MRRLKKPVAYFFLGTLTMFNIASCKKAIVEPTAHQTKVSTPLTSAQELFFNDFDSLVCEELTAIKGPGFKKAVKTPKDFIADFKENGYTNIRQQFITEAEVVTNDRVNIDQMNRSINMTYDEMLFQIDKSQMSSFAKQISLKYMRKIINKEGLEEQVNYTKAVENALLDSPLFDEKQNLLSGLSIQKYVLVALSDMSPDNPLFSPNGGANGKDCAIASLGMSLAFFGLITLEVGTGGLATGVVVVGFVMASTALTSACAGIFD